MEKHLSVLLINFRLILQYAGMLLIFVILPNYVQDRAHYAQLMRLRHSIRPVVLVRDRAMLLNCVTGYPQRAHSTGFFQYLQYVVQVLVCVMSLNYVMVSYQRVVPMSSLLIQRCADLLKAFVILKNIVREIVLIVRKISSKIILQCAGQE